MNNYFDQSFKELILDEGGYANNPNDTGKETYLGVSRVHNPKAKMWGIIDNIKKDIKNLNTSAGVAELNRKLKAIPAIVNEVKQIYKRNYWDVIQLDQLNSKALCHQIFDEAVNAGVSLAIKLAEELVGLPKTGKYSNLLLEKLKVYGAE